MIGIALSVSVLGRISPPISQRYKRTLTWHVFEPQLRLLSLNERTESESACLDDRSSLRVDKYIEALYCCPIIIEDLITMSDEFLCQL
jgi:hypothetical protein